MHRLLIRVLFALLAIASLASAAWADDWMVTKARGTVLQMVDGQWTALGRGDVVPDDRAVKTLTGARAELVRGKETIQLGPDTQVQIKDRPGSRPFTTVQEYYGDVEVDAEVRNVRHFAVQTPYVAAVVKGTHFEIISGGNGTTVSVQRGHVWVGELGTSHAVMISMGQSASAGPAQSLSVGRGGPSSTGFEVSDAAGTPGGPGPSWGGDGWGGAGSGASSGGLGLDLGPDGDLASVQVGGGQGVSVEVGGDDGVGVNAGGGEGVDVSVGGDNGLHVSVGGGDGVGVSLGGLHLGL